MLNIIDTNELGRRGVQKVHEPSKSLKFFGLIIFLLGLLTFTGSVFIGNYQITDDVLANLSTQIPDERLQKLDPLKNSIYDSKFELLIDIETHINDDGQVQPYQLGEYKLAILKEAYSGIIKEHPFIFFMLSIVLASFGALIHILSGLKSLPGIKNDNIYFKSLTSRGVIGILTGIYLIGFYIILYWYPEYIVNIIIFMDPVSQFIRNIHADRWFLYGTLYTFAVCVMGVRMFVKYRHSRYHLIRTTSIMSFQFGFAFLLPSIMERLNQPSMDLKNTWPLNYTFFMDWSLNNFISGGGIGLFLLAWGIILAVVVVPIMTFYFGKRWYCSWVCGCGGLAETFGDPFRHLSNKSLRAWKIERWMVHSVLVIAVFMTIIQISNYISGGSLFSNYSWRVNQAYSFLIGAAFAGVIGTGFYPLMGNRVWCRFGCPLAAILGIIQKFKSRFVITTNGGQCISCGNCSSYCEMGIDVRWYAQRGQNIIRASCVGCGVCAAVCPRGVLKLENTSPGERYNLPTNEVIVQ
jgi:polyferredoxin